MGLFMNIPRGKNSEIFKFSDERTLAVRLKTQNIPKNFLYTVELPNVWVYKVQWLVGRIFCNPRFETFTSSLWLKPLGRQDHLSNKSKPFSG